MQKGINKVIIVGNLGQDPEVRQIPNGGCVANLSLATSENWKDKVTGEQKEKTEWHRVSLFGKLAEVAGEYLKKGSQVYIEGQLQTRKWQDPQSGQDRYSTEVVVQGYNGIMQILSTKQQQQQQQQQQKFPPQAPIQQQGRQGFQPQQSAQPQHQGNNVPFDDDIPF